ncbi:unnamed protein product [marine sediment metagenome]|uniref:Uncharacterized protein n=1 Tax=marine sediment metagenome TaxID=412755 RepID=X0YRR5_9ZZZZ
MKTKETILVIMLFILFILLIGTIIFTISLGVKGNSERCEKVCNARGLAFYQWVASSHGDCGCFDKEGEIVYYAG